MKLPWPWPHMVVIPSMLIGYPFLAVFGQQKYANGSVILGLNCAPDNAPGSSAIHEHIHRRMPSNITETIVLIIRAYGIKKTTSGK